MHVSPISTQLQVPEMTWYVLADTHKSVSDKSMHTCWATQPSIVTYALVKLFVTFSSLCFSNGAVVFQFQVKFIDYAATCITCNKK